MLKGTPDEQKSTTDGRPRNRVFRKKPGFLRDARSVPKGHLLVLGGASCWATSGILLKKIMLTYDPTPLTLAFWRDFLTFVVLFLALVLFRRDLLRLERRALLPLVGLGVIGVGLFHLLWVYAVALLGVAPAHIFNYTAPAFVVIFSWLLWRESITWRKAAAVVLTFAGCVLVARAYDLSLVRLNWVGVLVGLGTGITWAIYAILGKVSLDRYSSWTVVTYAFGLSSLTLLMPYPLRTLTFPLSRPWHLWPWLWLLALLPTVAGFSLYTWGLMYLSASAAAITATVETLLAAILAWLLFGDVLSFLQILGGVLIIIGVVILSKRAKSAKRE
jgi:DME family drug/metabolite transporter